MLKLWENNIPYHDGNVGEEPCLFEYPVSADAPAPCVIVFPGGGYVGLADYEGEPISLWLNSLGIYSFTLRYRRTPYNHKGIIGDAQRAVRYVRANADKFNIDPERIGVLGFSAGGHLAAAAAVLFDEAETLAGDYADKASSRPDCAILCYPVISSDVEIANTGSFKNLMGSDMTLELADKYSLEKHVKKNTPSVFIWHTSEDACVPVANSLRFGEALAKNNIRFELHVYPEGAHGLGLAKETPRAEEWTDACAKWLRYIGF